ncbi:NACHT, LRR and PYD domains-containing protein 12-like isoform X3 [Astyanax mexicanus]|uniref:NACHT, LRR and PYD domains-containing protein 12-like isoform X2 n=1 Tax=Astyanax mexicanus TaxID=7994 RepID=UPI0020CAC6C1|nr:NACHT, LRR and PYD domains-containing protein 12-like isoform X2 [Astyanax mexicanus]XP_049332931.1 NACHT, LRR and PYD domains-containing protein 12-like isoform X2 [Astyanax mexicanus]XP_049332932.1 NACHT, LRR and PYD domains-containing protein 12-like isoform X2 [Astyanax mexicanus]XP_049332933.1 NACHT, LRR and PYD domains-containing protein 12-like isoform X2 [Astyanax mexicanus]XP_049332934.1 NACHT, LRR and PYD domains-containing protein 12-like isoform X3 [Astyanax mexicanus]
MMDLQNSSSGGGPPVLKEKRAASPAPSGVSMKSDRSMMNPPNFSSGGGSSGSRTETQRGASPEPSCVSMKSDASIIIPPGFSSEDMTADKKKINICTEKLDHIFKKLQEKFISLVKNELNTFKKLLSSDYSACSEGEVDDDQKEGVLKVTLHILRNMNQTDLANTLESKLAPACQRKLKSKLRDKYQILNEGISGHVKSALLNEIYTELYITEGDGGDVNQEHEVKQIEAASRKRKTEERPIKCNDIFKPLPEQNRPIRTVLTKGVAGIGKTVSVQKFILDWAEGEENQEILFIFPLPFRELNLMKEKKLSLVNLLQSFFPETQDLKLRHYRSHKIMFILDGLDECRLPLDFQDNENLVNIEEQTSVDVLLTNLIKGNLLPSALLWITSRPAAANQIPPECADQVTEVQGFSDPQKQEYFSKRISDKDLANKVFTHIRSSRSLYIMCHIPVFCWITATVLERMLSEAESGEIPKTLTQMFTHFLIFQIEHKNQKYSGNSDIDPQQTRTSILALGKLAFQQLEKGNLIFYEEDLRESGINIREVSVYSGVCTQIFREEHELHLGKVFSFVHLSVQEFLAALYAFLNRKIPKEQSTEQQTSKLFKFFRKSTMTDFLSSAIDRALQSESGHLDLFLRFLLGLSLESNQTLLGVLLTPTERISHSNKTVQYIKKKIEENSSPEKSINLFHCLNELNDHSLVQEVQKYLSGGGERRLQKARLSPAHWSALVFVLVNSEEELEEFNLSTYDPSEECLLRLLPVVKIFRRAVLASCNLGVKTCENLESVLNLENSSLKELDLSNNDLQDSGVELLSAGLKSSQCKLQILRLASCNLGVKTCENLESVLNLENSSLKELDLSNNDLQDSGVELLSAGLKSSQCKLQILRLASCSLGVKTCENLESVLNLENSPLKELDLSNNDLQDSGVELLSAGLKSSHCKLQILRLALCNIGVKTCENLESVLNLENSSLKELDLSNNDLQDSGVELLSAGLSSQCKLQILRLSGCMITDKGCCSLASALISNPSHLKELDLTYNHPGESGVKLLSARLEDPHCKLEKLGVEHGGKIRIKPGLKKYGCDFTLDLNTAQCNLSLSEENRRVEFREELQSYPDHPERFDWWEQVLSRERVTGRCYWEAEWSGRGAAVALSYKTISRKGSISDCGFGENINSWSLICSDNRYSVLHNDNRTDLSTPPSGCRRVGVYVDCPSGTLSFYRVSTNTPSHSHTHLHTFYTTFTQPLYAGFRVYSGSSVRLCKIE